MADIKNKIVYSALGVSGGVTGIALTARCSGNACASCFGCAGVGIMLLAGALIKKIKGGKGDHGMASRNC